MSLDFTVYKSATGEYVKTLSMPDMESVLLNIFEDETGVEGEFDDQTYLKDGLILTLPAKPADWAVFDYLTQSWTDPRTAEDKEHELTRRRSAAKLSRIDFLLAAAGLGIISEEDTIAAASGAIPPAILAMLATLTTEQQFEARVRWVAATEIDRMDTIILALAQYMGITDSQLDAIFRVEPLEELPPLA